MDNIRDISIKHEMSKIEQIMLAFDLSRHDMKHCDDIFSMLLDELDIDYHSILVYGDRHSHRRFVSHVKDLKYGIDGVYFFDVFEACKGYSNSYKFCLKNKAFFDEFDKKNNLKEYYIGNFSEVVDLFYEIAEFDSYDALPKEYIDSVNTVSEIIDGKSLELPYKKYNKDMSFYDLYEKIYMYDLLMDNEIYAEDLIEALVHVNEVKYFENINDTINTDQIKKSFIQSAWNFKPNSVYDKYEKKYLSNYNLLLLSNNISHDEDDFSFNLKINYLFKNEIEEYAKLRTIRNYIKQNGIKRRIDQINDCSKKEFVKVKSMF